MSTYTTTRKRSKKKRQTKLEAAKQKAIALLEKHDESFVIKSVEFENVYYAVSGDKYGEGLACNYWMEKDVVCSFTN